MWSTQHSASTDLSPADVWRTFVDIHTGKLTLPDGDMFEPRGPFVVGTEIAVTPAGQETLTSTIIELEPEAAYADRTVYGDLVLVFRHTFEATDDGTRVTHELTIDGPGSDQVGPELGPQISGDFGPQLQALFDAARVAV